MDTVKKYIVTVSIHSDRSAGWETWTDVELVKFEGDDIQELWFEAIECENKKGDYRSEIKYYKQTVELLPTIVKTECDARGLLPSEVEAEATEKRKVEYLKLKKEFEE